MRPPPHRTKYVVLKEPPGTPKDICRTGTAEGDTRAHLQTFRRLFQPVRQGQKGSSDQYERVPTASTSLHPLILLQDTGLIRDDGDPTAAKLNTKLSLNLSLEAQKAERIVAPSTA